METARSEGTVSVIVELSEAFQPEGGMRTARQPQAQRERLARAQNRVLAGMRSARPERLRRRYSTLPYLALEVTEDELRELEASTSVRAVRSDRRFSLTLDESRPLVGAEPNQVLGLDGDGWTIAVIGTGIDNEHPFIDGRVVAEACFTSGNGQCPNGENSMLGPGAGGPCLAFADLEFPGCDHETRVAGIAAGSGGIAPGADLISVLATTLFLPNGGVSLTAVESDVIAGLEFVYGLRNQHAIAAVNLSLGYVGKPGDPVFCDTPENQALKDAIDQLRSVGIPTLASSGNGGSSTEMHPPACLSSVISVGATTKSDALASFTDASSTLDLVAPGQDIVSPSFAGLDAASGTSFASPHVAGAWALLRQAYPTLSTEGVLTALKSTGAPILDTRNGLTYPRIQVDEAIASVPSTSAVELESFVPLSLLHDGIVASDLWGYASPSGREYAFVGHLFGTSVVEVTDPSRPVVIELIPGAPSNRRDIKTYREHAFITNENGGGLQVVDLRKIDSGAIEEVGNFTELGFDDAHNIFINELSGWAYVATDTPNDGFHMVDVSKPGAPTAGHNPSDARVHDLYVRTFQSGLYAGREIAFAFAGGDGVLILDVTDKSNPMQLSGFDYPGIGFTHQGWLSKDGRFLYVNDELDEINGSVSSTTTYVFDIQILTAPVLLRTFTNGLLSTDHNLVVDGDFVFEANYLSGLRIWDAAEVETQSPIETGFFDPHPEEDQATFSRGTWGVYPLLPSGTVLLSDIGQGLYVVDASSAALRIEDTAQIVGHNGKQLRIRGTGFRPDTQVWIDGNLQTAIFVNSRELRVAIAELSQGPDIVVQLIHPDGTEHKVGVPPLTLCDVNADGRLDGLDLLRTLQFALKSHTPSAAERSAADLNEDGQVDGRDSVMLLQGVLNRGGPCR